MEEAVIELRGIHNRFGATVVHEGIDLSVRRGEILAIIGASGSGKSVLLRTMALLHRPTSGQIRLFGCDARRLSGEAERHLRLRLGFMFQNGALFSSLTVFENVRFPLDEHTRLPASLKREIVMLKIALAGLEAGDAAKYPRQLSGGMVKRAALARTLALDPEVLFLDEPTSGLDPVTAGAFDELVVELKSLLDLTVVMVTHDLDTLWNATDRVAFLAGHRLVAVAPIRELVHHPHPAIAAYFAARHRRGGEWKPR
ncbi:phospholipid/cholesterol/gamma-HCH transport system ATP-binding protein [Methylomarinovum caldicuralii]|uniref:Phospholipid/cholesterol/gamma-HCH transport system ATP-binding protein n=1 Tax=Methylomarinovum caldicuralii TaxID=438856 RepID=A0AAU9C3M9_9GAMM|nr:ATP-binding cassette domain-containing protein [Methylomarinovum caldicuralii]BCX81759.1 phospholipid/cholesterol/gamma-HCH transport system ATP-binding protein [Methylomarinovum caldicuralii]